MNWCYLHCIHAIHPTKMFYRVIVLNRDAEHERNLLATLRSVYTPRLCGIVFSVTEASDFSSESISFRQTGSSPVAQSSV